MRPSFSPNSMPRWIRSRVGLAADVLVFERRGAEELVPVDGIDEGLQLAGVHPGGERSADQSSHARPRRHVDRNAVLLQPPDHADVRDAAGAAPSEGDAHSRRLRRADHCRRRGPATRRWRRRRRALQGRGAGRTQDGAKESRSHRPRRCNGCSLKSRSSPARMTARQLLAAREHPRFPGHGS